MDEISRELATGELWVSVEGLDVSNHLNPQHSISNHITDCQSRIYSFTTASCVRFKVRTHSRLKNEIG